MRKSLTFILLSLIGSPIAYAATEPSSDIRSVGINYGPQRNVIGLQGETKIPSIPDEPLRAQVFIKNFNQDLGSGSLWNTTGIGAAMVLDLTDMANLGNKIHPYTGIGLIFVSHSWRGTGPSKDYTGANGGLYFTLGVKFDLSDKVLADLNYNDFGRTTLGLEFKF